MVNFFFLYKLLNGIFFYLVSRAAEDNNENTGLSCLINENCNNTVEHSDNLYQEGIV